MSQLSRLIPYSGPGSGTVTSISEGTGITITPNPLTTTGTVALTVPVVIADGGTNATSMTNTDGVVYYDGTRLVTTTVGTSGQVLTSNGATHAPTFQNLPASGIQTIDGDTGHVTGSTVSIVTGVSTQNSGSSIEFVGNDTTTLTLNVTDGSGNTIIGSEAGNASISGENNTSLGVNTLGSLTSGSFNTGLGYDALIGLESGQNNVAIGWSALAGTTSGSSNIAIGLDALYYLETGSSNIAIGYEAGINYVGAEAHNIILGPSGGTISTSGQMLLGDFTNTTHTYIAGVAGVTVSNINAVTINTSTGQLGSEAFPASSISITGDSGGAQTGNSFTFTGSTTGLTFAGATDTFSLGGKLVIANGGTDSSSFNTNGVVISGTGSTSALTALSLSSGQVVIGGTSTPAAATLTAGTGITIANGNNTITISAGGGGFTWYDVTGGSATMAAESGYIADSGSLTTLTMPTSNSIGDTIKVVGKGSGGWKIVYGALQNIIFGSSATTATTGFLASTNANDCVELVCTTASIAAPIFTVVSSIGNITID